MKNVKILSIKEISEIIIDRLISDKIIEREDAEMYTYGLQQVCMNLVNTIVLMIMGIYMQMLFETVIFVISF